MPNFWSILSKNAKFLVYYARFVVYCVLEMLKSKDSTSSPTERQLATIVYWQCSLDHGLSKPGSRWTK